MNKKILTAIIGFALVLAIVPSVTFASLTEEQKQSIINVLISFGVDQTSINNVRVSLDGGTPTLDISNWCHTFNNNLGYANSGANEIIDLHIALQKEGISYYPDNINTYYTGTANALIKFQTKYGISPVSGYVGLKTRNKLNQLYGCPTNIIIPTTCKPSWQTGAWGICMNKQQTRTVTDSNNCGVITSKPVTIQTCTEKPAVSIKANNLDGPVNLFLTLGNGANIDNSGVILSQNINLQWTGVDISSCKASDSRTPTIFSGYKPSFGSETVTLSGIIKNTSSYSNKITDTFKITCVSTGSGNSVSSSVTVNLFYTVNGSCSPNWNCSSWTACASSRHTRTCTDTNGCLSLVGKPIETESCTMPHI